MTRQQHHGPAAAPVAAAPSPASARAPEVSSLRLLATLSLAGAVAGLLVVTVYRITLPAIEKYAGQKLESAVREVLKAPVRWDTLYLVGAALARTPPSGVDGRELPRAFIGFDESGHRLGMAVTAQEPGFQEEVLLMVGFDPASGAITGMKVLDQKETPGLGDKIERDSAFVRQFIGRAPPLTGVKRVGGGNPSQVQTITGATISSRAVIRIINHAVARWRPLLLAFDQAGAK